jgi:hypothetical protein
MVKCLFSMMMPETCCTADDVRTVGGQPGLTPFLIVSCQLLKLSIYRNTVLRLGAVSPHMAVSWPWMSAADTPFFHKNHVVHLCPWYSPSVLHDSAPLTDAIVLLKTNLHHPLLPSIGWMFSYPCPITRTLL